MRRDALKKLWLLLAFPSSPIGISETLAQSTNNRSGQSIITIIKKRIKVTNVSNYIFVHLDRGILERRLTRFDQLPSLVFLVGLYERVWRMEVIPFKS